MISKYTINYTVFDTTNKVIPSPLHLKHNFEFAGDLTAALDAGSISIHEHLTEKYGLGSEDNGVDLILRGITLDNAKELYQYITTPHSGDKE